MDNTGKRRPPLPRVGLRAALSSPQRQSRRPGGPRYRFLLYSHDTYGLGHLRRNIAIAWGLRSAFRRASILMLTGSPCTSFFSTPKRCDFLKLPGVTKDEDGRYMSREMGIRFGRILQLRAEVIDAAIRSFHPHLILVDHAPLGMAGELLPALSRERQRRPETRVVLGLRDIYDNPAQTRKSWRSEGVYAALEEVYDRILVYGQPAIFDLVREYALSATAASRVTYTGYIHQSLAPTGHGRPVSGGEGTQSPRVLITVGGGGDGYTIIDQYLEGLRLLKGNCPWHSVVVLGPLMSEELRRAARAKAKSLTGVAVIDFTPHLSDHLAAADVVLTMAGYNTLLEALALGKRVVAVPRVKPRTEQLIRSLKFQRLGLLRCVDPRPSTPAGLVAAVKKAMLGPPPAVASQLDLGGMKRMLKVLAEVLEDDPAQARLREWNGAGAHFADPAHNHA